MASIPSQKKSCTKSSSIQMILESKHSVVWKGNHWSDIVFTVTPFHVPSSYLGLRVYLKMKKNDQEEEQLIPCSAMNFSGGPNFLFLSKKPTSILGQNFTQELSSVCNFLFNEKSFINVRLHHDVLSGNYVSLKLMLLVATKSTDHLLIENNRNEAVERFRLETSNNVHLPLSNIGILSFQSDTVRIASYKLGVQEKFSQSEYTLHRKDLSPETFEWYNKNGGDMISIDVVIHLKDLNGAIVYDYPRSLRLKTELVYDDGTPAPIFPLFPLKKKGNVSGKKKEKSNEKHRLFRPTRDEPILGNGIGSQYFSFRIEEVSAHHNRGGFKLKVSPMDDSCPDVFYGIMEETIIVKSKPKLPMRKRGKGGRTSILQDAAIFDSSVPSSQASNKKKKNKNKKRSKNEIREIRKVSAPDLSKSSMYDKESNTLIMKIPTVTSLFTGCNGSKCLSCGEELKVGHGLCPSHHKPDCRFNMTLVPFIVSASGSSSTVAAAANGLKNYQDSILTLDDQLDEFKAEAAAESLIALSGADFCEI